MLLSDILIMRESDVASLVEFPALPPRPPPPPARPTTSGLGGTMDARENNVALAHPYHEWKWCSKFGWIPPSGLGGDSVTDKWTVDRRMDGRRETKKLLSHTLSMSRSDAASLVEFHPVV